jgi:hypothetical protein
MRPDHPSPLKGSFRCPFWQIGPNRSVFPDLVKSFPDQRI